MSRFLETIQIKKARPVRTYLHNERLNKTIHHFYPDAPEISLKDIIKKINIPDPAETYRCSLYYTTEIEDYKLIPYRIPVIRSLAIVEAGQTEYSYKYADRSELLRLYEKRGNCDDIMIIRDGMITDSYFANLAFYKDYEWYTPADPLLKGTRRKYLIQKALLKEADIHIDNLKEYQYCSLINAMLKPGDCVVAISNICK